MPKLYIDTNIYTDIYQSTKDPVSVMADLTAQSSHLITTDQTINEFTRNRSRVLATLLKQFRDSIQANPYCTSLIKHLPEFGKVEAANSQLKAAGKLLLQRLGEMKDDVEQDAVAKQVFTLLYHPHQRCIRVSDRAFARAQRRKALGTPPTSEDKHSIGDEVIWEALLEDARTSGYELIVVSRDKTYLDNIPLLSKEYQEVTKHKLIRVTDSIAAALAELGATPSDQLLQEEQRMKEQQSCPRCGSRAIPRASIGWVNEPLTSFLRCTRCGHDWSVTR